MEELLKKLLAAEVLTEETKQELSAAFTKQLEDAAKKAREEATASVTAELNQQWITERETLIEAIDQKVSEVLAEEIKELKEDIERFRDLEAEHAEKLVEAKGEMATQLKGDIDVLIEKLDKFLEIRLTSELEELREDVAVVKKNEFGKKVYDAFVAEFKKYNTSDNSAEGKLTETQAQLEDTLAALEDAEKELAKIRRNDKMREVLSPLTGRPREVMEAILKNVDTPMLDEAYKVYVGKVVKEAAPETKTEETKKDEKSSTSEKETKVLAEGEKKKEEKKEIAGKTKTGDKAEDLKESVKLETEEVVKSTTSDEEKARMRRLAGLE